MGEELRDKQQWEHFFSGETSFELFLAQLGSGLLSERAGAHCFVIPSSIALGILIDNDPRGDNRVKLHLHMQPGLPLPARAL